VVVSDASGLWGCGAYYAQEWFQLEWASSTLAGASIAVQELIPLVVAVALWGSDWRGEVVSCKTDNAAVVAVIATRTSWDKQLLRCFYWRQNTTVTWWHLTYQGRTMNWQTICHVIDRLSFCSRPTPLHSKPLGWSPRSCRLRCSVSRTECSHECKN
jgi:hypothetical protein